jgi:hypothetical protein
MPKLKLRAFITGCCACGFSRGTLHKIHPEHKACICEKCKKILYTTGELEMKGGKLVNLKEHGIAYIPKKDSLEPAEERKE